MIWRGRDLINNTVKHSKPPDLFARGWTGSPEQRQAWFEKKQAEREAAARAIVRNRDGRESNWLKDAKRRIDERRQTIARHKAEAEKRALAIARQDIANRKI